MLGEIDVTAALRESLWGKLAFERGQSLERAGVAAPLIVEVEPPDTYAERLVKYIPAEAMAFFLPTYALADSDAIRWLVLLLATAGDLVLLALSAAAARRGIVAETETQRQARRYSYVLSIVAFFAWAVGTSDLGVQLFGLTEEVGRIILFGSDTPDSGFGRTHYAATVRQSPRSGEGRTAGPVAATRP